MKTFRLNPARPFAEVHFGNDDPTLRNIRYQQAGRNFNADGRWIPGPEVDLAAIEDDPVPHFDTTDETDQAPIRALCREWRVTYEPGMTLDDVYSAMPANGDE